jgi:hypothetical protein
MFPIARNFNRLIFESNGNSEAQNRCHVIEQYCHQSSSGAFLNAVLSSAAQLSVPILSLPIKIYINNKKPKSLTGSNENKGKQETNEPLLFA